MNWRRFVYRGVRRLLGDRPFEILPTLRESERWTPDRLREAQETRLRALLLHAFEHVPYYREPLQESGVVRAGSPPRVDLSRFGAVPLLTRSVVREHAAELQDRRPTPRGSRRVWMETAGTTGEPIRVLRDGAAYDHRLAVKYWLDEWAGYTIGEPKVVLWTWVGLGLPRPFPRMLIPALGPYLRNETRLTANVLSAEILDRYIERIRRTRPVLILGLPGPLCELARRAETLGRPIEPPRAIIASAEPLFPAVRATIQRVFHAPVFDRYRAVEVSDVACECAERRGLHVSALTNYVEVLGGDGRPAEPGEVGEIVVTGLANTAMPLIRYRIGDRGLLESTGDPCPCGRPFPRLREITGRLTDSFVRPDGALVHGVYFHRLDRQASWLAQFQVIQTDVRRVRVKLVERERSTAPTSAHAADLATITAHVRAAMGDDCEVTFEFVDDIPLAPSGKYRTTRSLVAR